MKHLLFRFFPLILLSACASTHVEPFKSASDVQNITPEESRVWLEADKYDMAMVNGGNTYDLQSANVYLQSVMDKVQPEFKGAIQVRIAKSPQLNAFALPNGVIYFNIGLLSRLENEAQLATVLAHESAHFTQKHGYKQRQNLKNTSAFGNFFSETLAMSSTYGYSRDLEREADQIAFRKIDKAGYDTSQAGEAFEILAEEAKAMGEEEPFFFSSHPKLAERIEDYQELNRNHKKGGLINKQRFDQFVGPLRLASLESDLSFDRQNVVIMVLTNEKRLANYPPEARYYLAEAYLRRGEKGDDQRAFAAYQTTLRAKPGFAPTYRSLGIYYLKKNEYGKAESYFSKYIQLAPNAADVDYVRNYVKLAKQGGAK